MKTPPSEKLQAPRGALAVIALGLLATVAAPLLISDEFVGATALSYEGDRMLEDSRPAELPEGGTMQISDAAIHSTRPNADGYKVFRVSGALSIDPERPSRGGDVLCTIRVQPPTIIARTPNKRASYPRPSDGPKLEDQDVPETSIVQFYAKGTDLIAVDLDDAFSSFTNRDGILVEWIPFREGRQQWAWRLPAGERGRTTLSFASFWRTTGEPAARIACRRTTGDGSARVRTGGALGG
jgi:hypothetical protein